MTPWKPQEIIVHQQVSDDPVTRHILSNCQGVPVREVNEGSPVLKDARTMLQKILAGKKVLYIAPANHVVDVFTMPDDRVMCPDFDRLKLASNGCFYQCDWCYLKLTYRAAFPFITVRAQYDRIKAEIGRKLKSEDAPVIFNSGELADSLALEHLTGAAREFIPWFGNTENGYAFMLTKSDRVGEILDLPHNGHTILAWSLNNAAVSRKFEIGAPPLIRRLQAAQKAQQAGYPVRVRLDPIIPFNGWQEAYTETVRQLFSNLSPERITLGTLRFEEAFYHMRNTLFTTGPELPGLMSEMVPMFPPKRFPGETRPKTGKYSFSEERRIMLFGFVMNEIRKYSDCRIALCKESSDVWEKLGLDLSECSCVCQLDSVSLSRPAA